MRNPNDKVEEPKKLTEVGNGALCAGDPTVGPNEPATGKESGRIETTAFENRKDYMKQQYCHSSGTDLLGTDWRQNQCNIKTFEAKENR